MIHFALRRSQNIHWPGARREHESRSALKGPSKPRCVATGPVGSGQVDDREHVEKRLLALGKHTYLLDGDNVRHGFNRDLGFTDC
jgi:bifunctional enzyme CysN/CysC